MKLFCQLFKRDFIWDEGKIYKLLDSIMRGYPIGIALMWETYEDVQYRRFYPEYTNGNRQTYYGNPTQKKLKIVLDGQQRLQSLYIALYGKYEGKYLYFDVLSGKETDDFKEDIFFFKFDFDNKINDLNEEILASMTNSNSDIEKEDIQFFVKISELFAMATSEKIKFKKLLSTRLHLSEDDSIRLDTNLNKLDEVLTKDQNILKTSIIDENLPSSSSDRKTESDVLEAFVRINRQGTPLSRSDLIFSMLKLNWSESAAALPEFVDSINEGNSFEIDIDFVIRCLFAVSDLGTKFDVDLLRQKQHLDKLKHNFTKCCEAIKATVDAIQQDCWLASSKALGGYHTLVPFVYYLFHTPKHSIPNDSLSVFRKSLFLFGFTTPFSRYADSRLGRFIKQELKTPLKNGSFKFPFKRAILWVNYWEHIGIFGTQMIQRNPRLALYIVQNYSGIEPHCNHNSQEMDHIFPRSILREKGVEESEINHYANFWILAKGKNQNKSNMAPKKYFEDVSQTDLKRALIDYDMLNYSMYKRFLKEREIKILNKVKAKLGFIDDDFADSSSS